MSSQPIVHKYESEDLDEQVKLAQLAEARVRVEPHEIRSQPHLGSLQLVFLKSELVPSVVIEIVDSSGNSQDLIELDQPMQTHQFSSLSRIGEVSTPEVLRPMDKAEIIRVFEGRNCHVDHNSVSSTIHVRPEASGDEIVVTLKDGKKTTIYPGGDYTKINSAQVCAID